MTIWYILLAILGISVLVITHELGHYLMGKWLGFTITEFSIGLGPKLFGIKGKETEFTLRALPIGGSCRFFGEDGKEDEDKKHPKAFSEDLEEEAELPKEPDPRLFSSKPAWKRFLVVLAGPVMNILTCVVLSFVILLSFGTGEMSDAEYLSVAQVQPGGPAEMAGVEEGDILFALNGERFDSYEAFQSMMKQADVNGFDLTVLRGASIEQTETHYGRITEIEQKVNGGVEQTIRIGNVLDQETGNKLLKITLMQTSHIYTHTSYNVPEAIGAAFPYTWDLGKLVYKSLGMIITGQASCRDMTGIVGTVDAVSETMAQAQTPQDATYIFLWLMALIAVNLGIVNLFPLPALDGGRLIFIILEMIRKKPVPPEKEGIVHLVGMILLLALMVALTVSDLMRCFGG